MGIFSYNISNSNDELKLENAKLSQQNYFLETTYNNLQTQISNQNSNNENNVEQTITQKVDVNISADIEEIFETRMSEYQSEVLNELQSLEDTINNKNNSENILLGQNIFLQNGYYHGKIENGEYNDDTGNAFLLLLTDDKIIDLLYVGKMENGYFNDSSGNAWIISKWDDFYVYYRGTFENGIPNRKEGDIFLLSLNIEFLNKMINDININGKNSIYYW